LRRRARHDGGGQDESHFLETLAEIAASGRTPGDDLLQRYETTWQRRIAPVFKEEAY
jgi:glutamate--cysteine ligase